MNTNEEIRNGYIVTSQIKKLWAVQLELVKKVLEVCKKHNLNIWADSGTLIGTIREHGFIPWDDDIDLGMLRPDYDKLLKIADEEFKSPYIFQSAYHEIDYPRGHAQVRKENTTAILASDIDSPFHLGIFIDIFVYDAIPNDCGEFNKLRQQANSQLNQLRLDCKCDKGRNNINREKDIKSSRHQTFCQAFSDYENLFRAYPIQRSSRLGTIAFIFDDNCHYDIRPEHYSDTLLLPFEDIMMPVPVGYDAILRTVFGDYMKPVQAPATHGGFVIIDTEHNYTEYITPLRKLYYRTKRINQWKHIADKILYYATFGHRKLVKRPIDIAKIAQQVQIK